MRLVRAELHAHTTYSRDGHINFEDMLRVLRRRRIDLIAITDHDTVEGAMEFKRRAGNTGAPVHIVVGEEKTLSDHSHVIGLFLKEKIHSDGFDDAVREIHEQGGICVLPHPFRRRDGVLQNLAPVRLPPAMCFEIFNPKCNYHENTIAGDLLASGHMPVGGSDAHYASELGECVNTFPFSDNLDQSLRGALRGQCPLEVWGVSQQPGDKGRRYAPLYYRIKPYLRVPRRIVPLATRAYSVYRDDIRNRKEPRLELKHESR